MRHDTIQLPPPSASTTPLTRERMNQVLSLYFNLDTTLENLAQDLELTVLETVRLFQTPEVKEAINIVSEARDRRTENLISRSREIALRATTRIAQSSDKVDDVRKAASEIHRLCRPINKRAITPNSPQTPEPESPATPTPTPPHPPASPPHQPFNAAPSIIDIDLSSPLPHTTNSAASPILRSSGSAHSHHTNSFTPLTINRAAREPPDP